MTETESSAENKLKDHNAAQSSSDSKKKSADRPHHLTLILSIFAVCLSFLSLYESHASRHLSEETSRAMISLNGVKQLADWKWPKEGEVIADMPIEISMTNTGKEEARSIESAIFILDECEYSNDSDLPLPDSRPPTIFGWSGKEFTAIPAPDHLAPGITDMFFLNIRGVYFNTPSNIVGDAKMKRCRELHSVSFLIKVKYSDDIGNYIDNTCFEIHRTQDKFVATSGRMPRCEDPVFQSQFFDHK